MGLFKAISKQLLKLIEWNDNSHDTIVYKFPMDDRAEIMNGSTLVVREGQVAVFTKDGKIADIFAPGRYKLETKNLPVLTTLGSWANGFNNPFKCDVYYVSTTQFTNLKWGTVNPFTMRDKDFGMIRVRGFGSYSFRVNDAKRCMVELFGSKKKFSTADITDQLKSVILSNISDVIADSKISAIDLAASLTKFNAIATTSLQTYFEKLGFELTKFVVENLSFPEEVEKAIDSRSSLGIMSDKVDTYVKMEQAKAMRDAAQNTGTVGTIFGMNVAGGLGTAMAGGIIANNNQQQQQQGGGGKFCPNCGTATNGAKFCGNCGNKL
ncbi:MAG: SPFH domain-containing protein [Firmicutes bacterium]|nr:SPFH domain-containing protein [Bacillota bacterium]